MIYQSLILNRSGTVCLNTSALAEILSQNLRSSCHFYCKKNTPGFSEEKHGGEKNIVFRLLDDQTLNVRTDRRNRFNEVHTC